MEETELYNNWIDKIYNPGKARFPEEKPSLRQFKH